MVHFSFDWELNFKGLLCLTFTDVAVLAGADYEKCYYYYGSARSKSDSNHEVNIHNTQ